MNEHDPKRSAVMMAVLAAGIAATTSAQGAAAGPARLPSCSVDRPVLDRANNSCGIAAPLSASLRDQPVEISSSTGYPSFRNYQRDDARSIDARIASGRLCCGNDVPAPSAQGAGIGQDLSPYLGLCAGPLSAR